MLFFIGVMIVILSVGGGYVMHHGDLLVLWQVNEVLIICGSAIGAFLIANNMHLVKECGKQIPRAIFGTKIDAQMYLDLLSLLYDIFNKARREGMLAIEADIETPEDSGIFTKYPNLLKDHRMIEFIADNIRIITTSNLAPHEIDAMIDAEIETRLHELIEPSHAINRVADALPGFGIVAAVLGIVITMKGLGGPPEVLGQSVAAALVGTFLGIFLAYGFVGPLATKLAVVADEDIKKFHCVKACIVATSNGLPPQLAVEIGRKTLFSIDRPTFAELESHVRST